MLRAKLTKTPFIIFISLLIIAGFSHGFNTFHYPYYENDEGTYMSQAWSIIKLGKLAPYTYWYDHAPLGWVLIAIWAILTNGLFTFGASVNSGRVLMLLIHLVISALIIFISRRVSRGRELPGALAVLIFSLSPLGIYFQRRVLLDNIMILWVFVSLLLLLNNKLKLSNIIFSAVTFGIAVLTKENAIFFIPAFLLIIYSYSHTHNRKFAIVNWIVFTSVIISMYFLYALIKKEFFPVGFMGNTEDHVSLVTTLKNQYSRGNSLPFWSTESDFFKNFVNWVKKDPFTITAGILSTLINLIYFINKKKLLFIPILSLLFWFFLIRGKLVINFYITPLIPILALNIGITLDNFLEYVISKAPAIGKKLAIAVALTPVFLLILESTVHFTNDETTPQLQAIDWVKSNLPSGSRLVIDDSIYVDLHESRFPGDKTFPYADWSWKVEKDPEIYREKLKGDWKNIEYIVLSHEMLKQIREDKFNFIQQGLDNSFLVADWSHDSTSYIDIEKYISTNGDWMAVYKVNDLDRIELSQTWKKYKNDFIKSYGQVVDPEQGDATTSEGQSYAMLRAVWQNDKRTFDGVWKWTKDHLQHRTQDKLISWLWVKNNGEYKLGDSGSASDADGDIALSLLFAAQRWRSAYYYNEALDIIQDMWKQEVRKAGDRYILLPGVSGFETNEYYIVNPSYFSPAWYRIFALVDSENNWMALANDTYELLKDIPSMPGSPKLPPNWILVDKQSGVPRGLATQMNSSDEYGFDAFRIFWRISLDKKWFNTKEANDYLSKYKEFFSEELRDRGNIAAVYSLDATPKTSYSSISTLTAPISIFSALNLPEAEDIYKKNFVIENGSWGDEKNYYDQNWAWFSVALYHSLLPNLWSEDLLAKY